METVPSPPPVEGVGKTRKDLPTDPVPDPHYRDSTFSPLDRGVKRDGDRVLHQSPSDVTTRQSKTVGPCHSLGVKDPRVLPSTYIFTPEVSRVSSFPLLPLPYPSLSSLRARPMSGVKESRSGNPVRNWGSVRPCVSGKCLVSLRGPVRRFGVPWHLRPSRGNPVRIGASACFCAYVDK